MNSEKILKLLKSGIWEDALIAFNFMKGWTIEDIRINLGGYNEYWDKGISYRIRIGHNNVKHTKINDNLYAISGGVDTLGFFNKALYNITYIEI